MLGSLAPRRLLPALVLLAAPLLLPDAAGAQSPASGTRLFLVPGFGAGMDAAQSATQPSLDAWTLGAQIELVGRSRWTPLVAAHHWRYTQTCGSSRICGETGWTAEAGATRSFVPTSIFRPYAGAVAGVHHVEEAEAFLQGRAGVDMTPPRSPVTFRIEGRYHRILAQSTRVGSYYMLNTGLRFMLPSP